MSWIKKNLVKSTASKDYESCLPVSNPLWKRAVMTAGKYICDICGNNWQLQTHYKTSYSAQTVQPLSINVHNGSCTCRICHERFHDIYGSRFNTNKQYDNFKSSYYAVPKKR